MRILFGKVRVYSILAAVSSGVLLCLCFPPFEWHVLGWVAFVPLVLASSRVSPRRAAFLGWICGVVASLGISSWLASAAWWAPLFFAIYCPIFFIPVSVFISLMRQNVTLPSFLRRAGLLIGATVVWVASEYIRAHAMTGFPWDLLGASQYKQIPLIQIADWGGVYAISALLFFVNMVVAVTLCRLVSLKKPVWRLCSHELGLAFLFVALNYVYGANKLQNEEVFGHSIRVALVQPNRLTGGNSVPASEEQIYKRLELLTDEAVKKGSMGLIVWPELALSDCTRIYPPGAELIKRVAQKGAPLLVGMPDNFCNGNSEPDSFNSSVLFSPQGTPLTTYHKQKLVLFGECMPFVNRLPFLKTLFLGRLYLSAGTETVLFYLPENPNPFSVLICFEDTFPHLARRAVRRGATWLVNQTDDSWLDPGCGSRQQLANAIFRCIENRVPMVCCANTGITCAIDRFGRITQTLPPRAAGFQIAEILPGNSGSKTFYTRHGDLFAKVCLGITIAGILIGILKRLRLCD